MKKSRKKIPIGNQDGALSSNPFEALSPSSSAEPKVPETVHEEKVIEAPKSKYRVTKTRKGNLPVFVEKRGRGKVVTVIRNIEGDADALLHLLKRRCGAGGVRRDDSIEIQGDHREKVEIILGES